MKDIARPTVKSLPYNLPPSLAPALASYSMCGRNTFHTSSTGEIALESATGVKVDARELYVGFGDLSSVGCVLRRVCRPVRTNEPELLLICSHLANMGYGVSCIYIMTPGRKDSAIVLLS